MTARTPITTVAELEQLDEAEMVEGYLDGFGGDPEPGDNRSLSYWHGWRNGASDGRHRQIDSAQAALAHAVVKAQRRAAALVIEAARGERTE